MSLKHSTQIIKLHNSPWFERDRYRDFIWRIHCTFFLFMAALKFILIESSLLSWFGLFRIFQDFLVQSFFIQRHTNSSLRKPVYSLNFLFTDQLIIYWCHIKINFVWHSYWGYPYMHTFTYFKGYTCNSSVLISGI